MMRLLILILVFTHTTLWAQYYPGAEWQQKDPKEFKIKESELNKAVDFAMSNEYSGAVDLDRLFIKALSGNHFMRLKVL